MSHVCFVSYARADKEDPYVRQFVDDLRLDLSLALGVGGEQAVFFDTENLQIAAEWEPSIRNALGTARVFLSLCSPNYFESEFCGREYNVFLGRRTSYLNQHHNGRSCDVIIPLIWIPTENGLPSVVSQFQYSHPTLPSAYTTDGLRHMMRLNKYAEDYREFLAALVRKIRDSRKIDLPASDNLPALQTIESAFKRDAQEAATLPQRRGPSRTLFVFCAANRTEAESSGLNADLYGETGWEWAPYGSHIGFLAQDVTTKLDLRYQELEINDQLVQQIHDAERNSEIVLILLDPHTLAVPHYSTALRPYDQQYFINSAIIVPWGKSDAQMVRTKESILQQLNQQFPRKFLQPPLAHHWQGITSGEELRKALEGALTQMRMNVLALGKAVRRAESAVLMQEARREGIPVESKPTLRGPSGSTI